MNVASLDKATDKIIDRMSPEELARYVSDMVNSQAKKVSSGEITHEGVDQQIEIFTNKHLIFRDGEKHVRYLQALSKETNKHTMKVLGEEYIRYLNAEIKASELVIVSVRLANLLCDELIRHTKDSDISELITTSLAGLDVSADEHLRKIAELEQAKVEFLNNPRWKELGTFPDVVDRESIRPESPLFFDRDNVLGEHTKHDTDAANVVSVGLNSPAVIEAANELSRRLTEEALEREGSSNQCEN